MTPAAPCSRRERLYLGALPVLIGAVAIIAGGAAMIGGAIYSGLVMVVAATYLVAAGATTLTRHRRPDEEGPR